MPITFEVDLPNSLVRSKATGVVTRSEIFRHLRGKEAADVISWAELFDATDMQLDLSINDLHLLAAKTKRMINGRRMGKIAVVTNSFYILAIATAYGILTRAENPQFRIFKNISLALDWVTSGSPSAAKNSI